MSRVTGLPRYPVRGIAIRRSESPPCPIMVAAFEAGRNGAEHRIIGTVHTAHDLAEAWNIAARLRNETGLPILDLISPRPAGPGTGVRRVA